MDQSGLKGQLRVQLPAPLPKLCRPFSGKSGYRLLVGSDMLRKTGPLPQPSAAIPPRIDPWAQANLLCPSPKASILPGLQPGDAPAGLGNIPDAGRIPAEHQTEKAPYDAAVSDEDEAAGD